MTDSTAKKILHYGVHFERPSIRNHREGAQKDVYQMESVGK